jgi:hypothetical protein
LITHSVTNQRFLEAVFRKERESGAMEVSSRSTYSGAIATAEYSLLTGQHNPIALVLNADTDDPERIESEERTIGRILYRAAPNGWHVALAVPNVDAWVKADPRIRADFEANPATRDSRYNQAVRIEELVKEAPLDRDAIRRARPEFRALEEFIERSSPILQPAS